MALDIPSEPKVYTSVYDNFKGVDFTNDPSNVYRRRSPDGKNMLPDLDGRPFKRKGWKIELSADDFLQAFLDGMDANVAYVSEKIDAGTSTQEDVDRMVTCQAWKLSYSTVTPYRTYYFELGGIDYILVYCNLGVFVYDGDSLKYLWHVIDKDGGDGYFPQFVETSSSDAKRGFFYEANGIAGFYLFDCKVMYRYEDDGELHEIKPYVPTVLIGCDPATGAGTVYESVNILTRWRKVSFTCDPNNAVVNYKLVIPMATEIHTTHTEWMPVVRAIGSDGEWHTLEKGQTKDYTIPTNTYDTIQFNDVAKTKYGVKGEDNVTVEYVAREDISASVKVLYNGTKSLAKNNDGTWGNWENKYKSVTINVEAPNVSSAGDIDIYVKNPNNNLWTAITYYGVTEEDLFNTVTDPYSNKVTYKARRNTFWDNLPYMKDTSYNKNGKKGHTRKYELKFQWNPDTDVYSDKQLAFFDCSKFAVYGTGLVNQVFACGTTSVGYKSRIWYSKVGMPEYFPDTNYTEVGSNDTAIMGTLKCGEYLGVIKQGKTTDTSVYLAYPTSFDDETTYAVKQSISGIGAISNGAFNVLNEEPLFLSADGVMGIELSGEEHRLRSRSHFVNGRLTKEAELSTAISFVFDNMYWLAVGGNCYVLDGTQKSSWANEKTNLQYECYYLENIPAQCFAKMDNELYWSDSYGNLCKFKDDTDENMYMDSYSIEELPSDNRQSMFRCASQPIDGKIPVDGVLDLCKRLIRISYSYWGETADLRVQTRGDFFDTFMLNDFIFSNRQWQYSLSGWSLVNYGTFDSKYLPTNLEMEMTVTGANGVSYVCTTQPKVRVTSHGTTGYSYVIYLEGDPTGTNQNGVAGDSHGIHIGMLTEPFTVEFVVSFDTFNFPLRGNYEFSIGDYVCCGGDSVTYGYDDLDINHFILNSYGNIQSLRAVNNFDVCRVESIDEDYLYVSENICNVDAVWSTLADDDGMVHYFKNMKKKGCLVSLLPESDTGVEVWLKADEKDPVKIGETDVKGQTLPFEFYIKKKVKKYKRLQIICKNSGTNDGFGIDQIIKSYTVGNYSKKRG